MSHAAVTVERVGEGVVIRPRWDTAPRPFASLTDEIWDLAFEQPMQGVIEELANAFQAGVKRIVVVVPTLGLSGGAQYTHVAAAAEGLRVLVKGVARGWGEHGVTVNVLAVHPRDIVDDPGVAGGQTLWAPALEESDPTNVLEFLCSPASAHLTGQTLVVDGGVLM